MTKACHTQGRYFEGAPIGIEHAVAHMDEIGETQSFNNYPLGWAMAGNTPCKFYKQNTHGGGVRDPFVVHYPARLADQAGSLRHQFHHVTDVVPTVLQMIGFDAPTMVNGTAQLPIHGTSMVYALTNPETPTEKRVQHFEMLGHRGIVADGWRAVTIHQPRTTLDQDAWELYNLNEDFSEFHDLAEHPEKLRELMERWWGHAGLYQVLSVDGVEVATVELERIVRGWAAFSGMDVGCDNGAPVGLGYESPFRFTGTIDRVEIELLGRVGPNPTVAMSTEMGKQ